ncbi:hypothetical protein [Tautonia sociabilis]|uniref:DUF1329 domain-containing protein n=1 Tax=Tautonia sociabilis TaxID=2080755 RepID=A0A432MLG6_9BACT|nr:hypothetical protein [Tautonia sociabilis]RUL88264.1 hypothetical protein TsocGM_07975 [Tautonia sociabilis]
MPLPTPLRRFLLALLATVLPTVAVAQAPHQPRVAPGPVEPDWVAILEGLYHLDMVDDLLNPVESTPDATPGLFRKAGDGPVTYRPLIALGLETVNRGGFYVPGDEPGGAETVELWSYRFKNTGADLERGENLPPPLLPESRVEFDPGDRPFGLWVANDGLDDGGVFTQPAEVRAVNQRLAPQPYKAMIYPYRDPESGELVTNSYLIGWEYSTNDDFQDVVCRVANVELIPAGDDR